MAAITLKRHAPVLDVTVVRSKEIGVIGVGEGSTVGFPRYLHTYLAIDPAEFYRVAQPSWKLGLRFIRWGPREQFHYSFAVGLHIAMAVAAQAAGLLLRRADRLREPAHGADGRRPRLSARTERAAADHARLFLPHREPALRGFSGGPRRADRRDVLEDDTVENVECDEEGVASLDSPQDAMSRPTCMSIPRGSPRCCSATRLPSRS